VCERLNEKPLSGGDNRVFLLKIGSQVFRDAKQTLMGLAIVETQLRTHSSKFLIHGFSLLIGKGPLFAKRVKRPRHIKRGHKRIVRPYHFK